MKSCVNTVGGTNLAVDSWLVPGLSAIYPRLVRGTTATLRSWLLTNVPTHTCLCKPYSCKAGTVIIFTTVPIVIFDIIFSENRR